MRLLCNEASVCLLSSGDSGWAEKKHQLFREMKGRWTWLKACEEIGGHLYNVILSCIFQRRQFHCKVDKYRTEFCYGQRALFSDLPRPHTAPFPFRPWFICPLPNLEAQIKQRMAISPAAEPCVWLCLKKSPKLSADHVRLGRCWTWNGVSAL